MIIYILSHCEGQKLCKLKCTKSFKNVKKVGEFTLKYYLRDHVKKKEIAQLKEASAKGGGSTPYPLKYANIIFVF